MKNLIAGAVSVLGLVLVIGCGAEEAPGRVAQGLAIQHGCGQVQSQTLYAGRHIDAGEVRIWNDETTLFVEYGTSGGWLLSEVHLHVAESLSGIPQKNGNPIPGQFQYKSVFNPLTDSAIFEIPLDDFLGTSLFIAAHAVVVRLNSQGGVLARETGWGHGPGFPGKNWATYIRYQVQPCDPPPPPDGELAHRTQTQGGWGSGAHGNNPGAFRDANFAGCFPSGIEIGCAEGPSLEFLSSSAIQAFLPQGGTPGVLVESAVDPLSSSGGVLAGQVLALALNVGFDECLPDFGASDVPLASLVVQDPTSACLGLTVAQVLDLGHVILGGCGGSLSASAINGCVSRINENFVDGSIDLGFLALP